MTCTMNPHLTAWLGRFVHLSPVRRKADHRTIAHTRVARMRVAHRKIAHTRILHTRTLHMMAGKSSVFEARKIEELEVPAALQ